MNIIFECVTLTLVSMRYQELLYNYYYHHHYIVIKSWKWSRIIAVIMDCQTFLKHFIYFFNLVVCLAGVWARIKYSPGKFVLKSVNETLHLQGLLYSSRDIQILVWNPLVIEYIVGALQIGKRSCELIRKMGLLGILLHMTAVYTRVHLDDNLVYLVAL